MNKAETRKLLSMAFEPCDGGYLYFKNRWSRGVQVTADEREQFLSSDALAAMKMGNDFSKRAPVAPPRQLSSWQIVDAFPVSVIPALTALAIAAGFQASRADPPISWLFWVVTCILTVCAAALAGRRIRRCYSSHCHKEKQNRA